MNDLQGIHPQKWTLSLVIAIIAASLGFFVDLYDIIIVSVVRQASLTDLGFSGDDLLEKGVLLLNTQMSGMLLGGFLWGIIGDRKGRLSVLFGSILLYSTATFFNAFVTSYDQYLALRFLAGLGLAGELGAAITLVAEQMPQKQRGLGPAMIASFGMLGAIFGAVIGGRMEWTFAYKLGGFMGFALLILRLGVLESKMFLKAAQYGDTMGNLTILFGRKENLKKYLCIILMGFPGWYINGIAMTFTPEIAAGLGMTEIPRVSTVFLVFFLGFTFGDFSCGVFSQFLQSRKKAILYYISAFGVLIGMFFIFGRLSVITYYIIFACMGFFAGYTIVLLTMAAEMFGTNIRATVTTSALNLIRGSVIPQTLLFTFLTAQWGVVVGAVITGALSLAVAMYGFTQLHETFHADINFLENEKGEKVIIGQNEDL
ncbi:MAG TPA: MFS transporter [Saprospiraceae bacterium]|nr:MFS transporter [Saprospiraceae bacterium]